MDEFPGNSRSQQARASAEPPKIERVTSARKAERRKRGLGRQFKDTFMGGDDAQTVAGYLVDEVIIPELKDLFVDTVQRGVERLVHGDSVGRGARRSRGGGPINGYADVGRVNYQSMSSGPTRSTTRPQTVSRRSRARHDFADVIIPSRREAQEVLDQMYEILSRHGDVTVAHLYELTGVEISHTDNKWGWTELRGSKVIPMRRQDGFLLDLPEPQPLD